MPARAVTGYALNLAPLVFVRPSELRQAEWTEFRLAGVAPLSRTSIVRHVGVKERQK